MQVLSGRHLCRFLLFFLTKLTLRNKSSHRVGNKGLGLTFYQQVSSNTQTSTEGLVNEGKIADKPVIYQRDNVLFLGIFLFKLSKQGYYKYGNMFLLSDVT